jgi:uncharacterized BrkB/YihY/UPF0761 family membrane protein
VIRRLRLLYDRAVAATDRHRSLSVGFAVVRRDVEVCGTLLAGALAFRLFIWLLPCCLLLTSVLGFATTSVRSLDELSRDLGMSPLTSSMLRQVAAQAEHGRYVTMVVSLVLLSWAGLTLGRAMDRVHDRVWRGRRGRGPKRALARTARYNAALLLVVVGNLAGPVAVAATGGSAAVVSLPSLAFYLATGMVVLSGEWPLGWRATWPGALLLAVGIEGLHLAAVVFLPSAVARSSQLYGTLGVAASLLLWLAFMARLLVLGQVLNAVLAQRRAHCPPPPGDATPPVAAQPVPGDGDGHAGGRDA